MIPIEPVLVGHRRQPGAFHPCSIASPAQIRSIILTFMSRRSRIFLPGVPIHFVQRGRNRDDCFLCEDDFLAYRRWLGDALATSGCALHAYVLMSNHVHLLLTAQHPEDIPRLAISLGRRYVQYFNQIYHRSGTLWESRYKSSLVQTDLYFLQCQRYIELNPVRAAMVTDPADYRWSSYRANALGLPDPLLTAHIAYTAIAQDAAERRAAYRALFSEFVR